MNKSMNPEQKLYSHIFDADAETALIRDGYGKAIVELGEKDERIVALCADLAESTRTHWFKEKFPQRYIEIGVAEQNLAAVASGIANYGKIPFISSYASFSPGRNNEQIRTNIALTNLPVKIIGAHAGISVGPDGATHQALEDVALMRVLPNMTVFVPCDMEETRKATIASVEDVKGPAYIRMVREKTPVITTADSPFRVGKANVLWGDDSAAVAIIACGSLVAEALYAAKALNEEGVEVAVINMHTIKPLDTDTILRFATKVNGIVTVEEHQTAGGLGSAVAEFLSENFPTHMEFIGVKDKYGQTGQPEELLQNYGLKKGNIMEAVKKLIQKAK